MQRVIAIVLLACVCGFHANASSYNVTFKGTQLFPANGDLGVPGVTHVTMVYNFPALPENGACKTNGTLISFSDGKNSLKSLTKAGYIFSTNVGDPNPVGQICADYKTGKITTGGGSVTMSYPSSCATDFSSCEYYYIAAAVGVSGAPPSEVYTFNITSGGITDTYLDESTSKDSIRVKPQQ